MKDGNFIMLLYNLLKKCYLKEGKSLHEIITDIQQVYGGSVVACPCIREWFKHFNDGKDSVTDNERKGSTCICKN